jgi:hypothetical protein
MAQFTPKLSFASVGGKRFLKISGADWQRVETAYRNPLSRTLRRKIREATQEFVEWAVFEVTVKTNSEAQTRAKLIKAEAREFRRTIFRCPSNIGRDADFCARHLICKHLDVPFENGRDGLHNLVLKFERLVSKSCDLALHDLVRERESGFRKGAMWNLWVRKLTAALRARRLPIEARKDTDKHTGLPSPFVGFLRELQKCIPTEFQRSVHSDGALAQAVYTARAERRREPKRSPRTPK